jgi:hypothetical protein
MKAPSSSSHHQYSYEPVAAAAEASPEQLTTSLTPSTNTDLPRATSTALIQVTAPATLPEGYSFEASLGDRVLTVQVPVGGVEEGQRFTVPLPADVESAVHARVQIPVGKWRDGLFCGNLCNYGVCHPHCWTACCCTTGKLRVSIYCCVCAVGLGVCCASAQWRPRKDATFFLTVHFSPRPCQWELRK